MTDNNTNSTYDHLSTQLMRFSSSFGGRFTFITGFVDGKHHDFDYTLYCDGKHYILLVESVFSDEISKRLFREVHSRYEMPTWRFLGRWNGFPKLSESQCQDIATLTLKYFEYECDPEYHTFCFMGSSLRCEIEEYVNRELREQMRLSFANAPYVQFPSLLPRVVTAK